METIIVMYCVGVFVSFFVGLTEHFALKDDEEQETISLSGKHLVFLSPVWPIVFVHFVVKSISLASKKSY